MAKLIYSAFTSLDGYVADETGNFEWAELDEEVHAYINNRERQVGTYLLGRKMYETMSVWETPDELPPLNPAALEFLPIWQAAEKIVYSTTLQTVSPAHRAGHRGRRQSLSARQGLREARASRRTQVRPRSGLRSVPGEELTMRVTASSAARGRALRALMLL